MPRFKATLPCVFLAQWPGLDMPDELDIDQQLFAFNAVINDLPTAAAMAAASVIEAEIRRRVPVDTGLLRDSLTHQSHRRQAAASVTIEMPHSGPDGTEHYAIFKEYGTSKMRAEPFMRPGFAASKDVAIQAAETLINQKLKPYQ